MKFSLHVQTRITDWQLIKELEELGYDVPSHMARIDEEQETLIREAVADYLERLPEDSDHPFVAARPDEWKLTIWGVVLDRAGCQGTHLHPTGWLSGVYYVRIPKSIGTASQEGWIEFGRPPASIGCHTEHETIRVQPEAGRMVLFPSYFYHHTVPFKSEGTRISIAFDLMPA